MLFPCSGGSLFGKAFGSEVVVLPVVTPKRNRRCQRCISKAIGGANCAPQLQKPPFFKDSGRDVWHWRSLQRRSKNGVIELARPCCFPVPEAAFLGRLLGQKSWFCRLWYPNATEGANGVFRRQLEVQIAPQSCKTSFFYRFWMRRLTLKITPTQVEKRCPWVRQAMLFPCSGGSLFGKAFGSEVVVLPVGRRGRRQWAAALKYNLLLLIFQYFFSSAARFLSCFGTPRRLQWCLQSSWMRHPLYHSEECLLIAARNQYHRAPSLSTSRLTFKSTFSICFKKNVITRRLLLLLSSFWWWLFGNSLLRRSSCLSILVDDFFGEWLAPVSAAPPGDQIGRGLGQRSLPS